MPDPQTLIDFARDYGHRLADIEHAELTALKGDAGFRRYFRCSSRPNLMLVDSPPCKERNLEFVRVNHWLRSAGVRVPEIHAVDFKKGWLLLEDLGTTDFQTAALATASTAESRQALYTHAMDQITQMLSVSNRPDALPDYSAQALRDEMQLFPDWFLKGLLGFSPNQIPEWLDALFDELVQSASQQPQRFVHRDFHCRNLMLDANGELATIDYQDAVWGPVSYDLVSLLKDCYLKLPDQAITDLRDEFGQRLNEMGILDAVQQARWAESFELMGLQRHIKVLGIFARLDQRDGKPRYLQSLPLVIRHCLEVNTESDLVRQFQQWFQEQIVPQCRALPWYKDWQQAGPAIELRALQKGST